MRKLLSGLALVLACSQYAGAQMMDVYDSQMQGYDIGALKEGEWVEYESVNAYTGAPEMKSKMKWACVKVDGDMVWVEQIVEGNVTLYGVSKADRKIKEAYTGKAGETGKKMNVKETPKAPEGTPQTDMSGTGKVSSEKVTVKGTEFDCEKLEMDITIKMSGMEMKSKTTTWTSEKVPFRTFTDEKAADPYKDKIKWEGKPSGKGATVKMVNESQYGKSTMTLVDWGTDAKMSLKK